MNAIPQAVLQEGEGSHEEDPEEEGQEVSPYFKDLLERVAATFAFTFLSVFSFSDLSTGDDAAIAGAAAVASLVKGWLGKYLGSEDHAGLTK